MTDYASLDAALTEAVVRATGIPTAKPREGQLKLSRAIYAAAHETGGSTIGKAPTGLGKSLAYLVPAALDAAERGRRTVISTESLALQAQILDKDAPVVAAAVAHLTGVHVNVQVLKGWSNWACMKSTLSTAHALLGEREASLTDDPSDEYLSSMQSRITPLLMSSDTIEIDGVTHPTREVASVTYWSMQQHMGAGAENIPGDRASYDSPTGDKAWPTVSVSSADCVGVKKCPFARECKARMAKERAGAAHIIVTNHAMLATQAAKGISVVIGSKALGQIDNIFIDEAHGLPSIVRDQGAAEVSGRRIRSAVRAVRSVLDNEAAVVKRLIKIGDDLAASVDDEIGAIVSKIPRGADVLRLTEGQDALMRNGSAVEAWIKSARGMVATATKGRPDDVKVRRVRSRLDSLLADVSTVVDHRTGVARWVEKTSYQGSETGNAVKSQPIDVGGLLNANLWNAPLTLDKKESAEEDAEIEPEEETYPLSVACVSATLPGGFGMQVGLGGTPTIPYVSPFSEAFKKSVLFVPRATSAEDFAALSNDWGKFDTKKHLPWAIKKAQQLFEAHRGAGLMLSATSSGGQAFAAALRESAAGRWNVYSQWDGASVRSTIAAWKEDIDSVMVGTRSLMTGVDAPGPTNSLVVVDRVPRSAGNPVDDARVEDVMERLELDKWSADRLVYAADAALLIEQALGRLIRSSSDSGMGVVLDPRLLKIGKFSYNERARQVYMNAISHPQTKMSKMEDAVEYLAAAAARRARR